MSQDRFQGRFLFLLDDYGGSRAAAAREIRDAVRDAGGTIEAETHVRYAAIFAGEFRAIKRATRNKGSLYQEGERRRLDDLARKRPDLSELLTLFRGERAKRASMTDVQPVSVEM